MARGRQTEGAHSPDGIYQLYLMRHGIAADRDASLDDSKRPLTAEGSTKLRAIARGLARIGVELDWIVSSPFVRAFESAEIIAEQLAPEAAVDRYDALTPAEGSAQKILSFLSQHPERPRVLLAGHEPSLSKLAAELVGASPNANFAFKKGGCCLITWEEFPPEPPGRLTWWLTPRLLRKLGT
jgi:phosphohistidine phosphatase